MLPKELTKVPRPNALPKNITLEELAQQNYVLAVQSALSEFKLRCPNYVQKYQSNKNAETIMLHFQKRGDYGGARSSADCSRQQKSVRTGFWRSAIRIERRKCNPRGC